jgi:hypothetical protein
VKLWKDYCRRECTESKKFKYLSVFEEVPQGVHAGIFPKGLGDFQASSGGIEPSQLSKGGQGGWCLEHWKEASQASVASG